MDFYGSDLAHIHDVGFGGFSRSAAPALLALLRRHRISGGLAVDLGCGSGIWLRELHESGFAVFGVDVSPAMIELARRRVPEGRFQCVNLAAARLPPCDVVTSLGECLNYIGEDGAKTDLPKLFTRVWRALRPGGLFVFDLAEPGRGASRHRHIEGPGWAVLVDVQEESESGTLTRRITSFRQTGEFYRRASEVHRLKLHRRSEVVRELRQIGFRVRTASRYGDEPLPPGCVAFLARKPRGAGAGPPGGRPNASSAGDTTP